MGRGGHVTGATLSHPAATVRARTTDGGGQVTDGDRTVLLAEYDRLKEEQSYRLQTRDTIINFAVVATGGLAAFAINNESTVWLALPWVSTVFGWSYLMTEEKITALGRYVRHHLAPRLGPGTLRWESSKKRTTTLAGPHKAAQLVVNLLLFVAPALTAVGLWTVTGDLAPGLVVLAVAEVVVALVLGFFFLAHSDVIDRWQLGDGYWQDLDGSGEQQ